MRVARRLAQREEITPHRAITAPASGQHWDQHCTSIAPRCTPLPPWGPVGVGGRGGVCVGSPARLAVHLVSCLSSVDWAYYRHPLLPPAQQGKARRLLRRIRAMPDLGGQPLPRRLCTCPALRSSAQVRSPVCHGRCFDLHQPVGINVALLHRTRRSRVDAGRVMSPANSRAFVAGSAANRGQRFSFHASRVKGLHIGKRQLEPMQFPRPRALWPGALFIPRTGSARPLRRCW